VGIYGRIDGPEPLEPEPIGSVGGAQQERRVARSSHMAAGTLACPVCDAPVALLSGPVTPADDLFCPLCDHTGVVRDFLSLTQPTRPAHVNVRLVLPVAPAFS
jgi:hypothetical protein